MGLARGPDGSVWVGIFSDGPGRGLARFVDGTVRSFVTPTFDGSKFTVFSLRFDRDGNLWVGTANDGVFRVHGNAVDHYERTEGLSGDYVRAFFEDREGIVWAATNNGVDRFHDPRVTTFSAAEGLGADQAVGILASRDGTMWVANADSLDHIDEWYGFLNSHRHGFRVSKSLPCWKTVPETCGQEWMTDSIWLKMGASSAFPNGIIGPLDWSFGLAEDSDGNIWAVCAGAAQLVRIRDFQVQEEFSRAQIPAGRIAPNPQGGIWIATSKGELGLFRNGALHMFLLIQIPRVRSPIR